MGVSGCGKSTLGQLLADSFYLDFVDADDYHSEANMRRMKAGIPLTDNDREPWMNDLCQALRENLDHGKNCVLAHSALRRTHRDRLRQIGFRTLFLHLVGTPEFIARRISGRSDHYMPVDLLDSQFDALEATDSENDIVKVDIESDAAQITDMSSRLVDSLVANKVYA
jgi:gluconokinase